MEVLELWRCPVARLLKRVLIFVVLLATIATVATSPLWVAPEYVWVVPVVLLALLVCPFLWVITEELALRLEEGDD